MLHRLTIVLVFVFATSFLGGCAGGPKYSEVVDQFPTLSGGQGRIFFYRDSSPFGSAIQPSIRLNGEAVGKSKPGGFFFVDRGPGSYEANCTTEAEKRLTFTLSVGERKYIRTRVTMGLLVGQVHLRLEDETEAMKTLGKASYTGTPLGNP